LNGADDAVEMLPCVQHDRLFAKSILLNYLDKKGVMKRAAFHFLEKQIVVGTEQLLNVK